ncbi:GNAT family N-acetyltransferase [Trinickia fusca]|uniref:GNAT family N-acetyltransferase n=1 Tax=Trinickia fusca TaxID=2419777 RepID=A0A494XQN3_9BURK|nr:GNAT family N-acetyltransferase [Trinickia fusca]RKP50489.1 GNAT family N-acetyltransferase [Trinickia fusca]
MTEPIELRTARPDDYAAIVALQKANVIHNLSEAEQRGGFLSAEIPEDKLSTIALETGIVVAYDGSEFAGFVCISRLAHWHGNAIIDALVTSLGEEATFEPARTCLLGPGCLAQSARGKGVIGQLIEHAIATAKPRFRTAITFIAADNERSLRATEKIGYRAANRFVVSGREYCGFWLALS